MNAVDTNVLVYFVDRDEQAKRAQATKLLEQLAEDRDETILLWQVAGEFLSCMRRWENDGRITRETTLRHLAVLESMFSIVFP